jgi:hypothetical protein
VVTPVVSVAFRWIQGFCWAFVPSASTRQEVQKPLILSGLKWSEREDLNLRPLVSQTSALTGLRHAPMPFP